MNREIKFELEAEAHRWMEVLVSGPEARRYEAAEALSGLGVQTRGSTLPRGSLTRAAMVRHLSSESLEKASRLLVKAPPDLRCQLALALGEWGGEREAQVVAHTLASDPNERVQLFRVASLRTIGGPDAAQALGRAAAEGSAAVRDAAIRAIGDLATGGSKDDLEHPQPDRRQGKEQDEHPAVREPLRTRGGARHSALARTIEQAREDQTLPRHIRSHADEVLRYLK